MIYQVIGQITQATPQYGSFDDPAGGLTSFLNNIISLIITIASIYTLANFIIAGYQYLTSEGNPQKLSSAGNRILNSLIGLAITAASFIVAAIVGKLLYNDTAALLDFKIFAP